METEEEKLKQILAKVAMQKLENSWVHEYSQKELSPCEKLLSQE